MLKRTKHGDFGAELQFKNSHLFTTEKALIGSCFFSGTNFLILSQESEEKVHKSWPFFMYCIRLQQYSVARVQGGHLRRINETGKVTTLSLEQN